MQASTIVRNDRRKMETIYEFYNRDFIEKVNDSEDISERDEGKIQNYTYHNR